jgi:hypothetical protein
MFGTVLDKLQTAFSSLFSTSFLLGNFFPVLIIAIINFALAWIGLDGFATWAFAWNPVTGAAAVASAEFVLLVLLAVLAGPLVPVLRSLLDGAMLPPALRRRGDEAWRGIRTTLQQAADAARDEYVYFNQQRADSIAPLQQARAQGNQNPANTDEVRVDTADARIAAVTNQMHGGLLPQHATLEQAIAALQGALEHNPTTVPAGDPHAALADRLDKLHRRMIDLLSLAKDTAYRNAELANYKVRSSFAPNEIWPTRVGNARAAIERYPKIAYNISYDFLWPRLRMILLKQAELSSAVDTAKAKLEFGVLMTWLTALTVAVWLPLLAFAGHSFALYFVVGILGPAAVVIFYLLVDETQKAFGEVMVMTVDALHFDLLTALHQRIPNTLAAERATWMELQQALYAEGGLDFRYRHPPKPS